MEDSQEIKRNAETYKMTLLFTQTRLLHKSYNQEKILSPFTYYLVDKDWLDNYKKKNNYDKIVKKLKDSPGYDDYFAVRDKLLKDLDIDKNNLTSIEVENVIEYFFLSKKQNLEKYQLNVPKNIELVLMDCIDDCCLNNSEQLGFTQTEVFVGSQSIMILDEEKKNILYCCSLVQNEGDNFNFCVKGIYFIF